MDDRFDGYCLHYLNKVCQVSWWQNNHEAISGLVDHLKSAANKGRFCSSLPLGSEDMPAFGDAPYVLKALGYRVHMGFYGLEAHWKKPVPTMLPVPPTTESLSPGIHMSAIQMKEFTESARNREKVHKSSDKRFRKIYRDLARVMSLGGMFHLEFPVPRGMTLPEFEVFKKAVDSNFGEYRVECQLRKVCGNSRVEIQRIWVPR